MSGAEIESLFTNLVFPVAACVALWRVNMEMQATLTKLTTTLELMCERLRKIEDAVEIDKEAI